MKIAIVSLLFPPKSIAGTEIASYNLAKNLSKRGHEIHVITSKEEGLSKFDNRDGFYVHRLIFPQVRFLGLILFSVQVFLCLRKINPQIVHIQKTEMGIPGFLAKKILKKRYIVYCRGSEVYFPWQFKDLISKVVFANASAVIALTKHMKMELRKNYNVEIFVIPNGIDLKKFLNIQKEDTTSNGEKIVLYVGSLRPVKGVKYLIEAMRIVIKNKPDTKLVIVGDGTEREQLEMLVRSLKLGRYIKFVGMVPNENVPEYMISSDIFVLPSLSEGFPNVILEAMASGLPIICTEVGGMREIIKEGENGFMVSTKNIEELSEKVLMLLQDDELRKNISKNNKIAVKKYDLENVVERIEKIYEATAKS